MNDDREVLLVVEDDKHLQEQMRSSFNHLEVVVAEDRDSAIAAMRRIEPAVVTLDLGLPPSPDTPEEGFRLLRELLSLAPDTKVIAMTGENERAAAVRAIGMGAYNFFAKPLDADVLKPIVARAFRVVELEREHQRLAAVHGGETVAGLLTCDPAMLKLCHQVVRLAPTRTTVLLQGESGTGKELLARALHAHSPRSERRFVAINCAAIPDTLLESELFGHEKGAFTGAVRSTPGKIEVADGGTLFLDEIGDLPMLLQGKLLRFLQERVIERIGGRTEIPVDVRIVCATHRNLRERIAEGQFREDLFYRLTEVSLMIPPLRERAGDSSLLARALVQRFASELGRERLVLRDDALDAIATHRWPGNVRELENVVKRAVIMAQGRAITAADLDLPTNDDPQHLNLRQVREEAEHRAVTMAMARCDGNVVRAAELLGVSRPTLYDMLKRFGMR
ncbi:MAG: PEP-CTERM-box response regulator transcription factor [Solirubrobacteraceae bacterium]|nr:PEP-CTERM-box response regulator transcription factor [Solirubrobacteraceae bacterium]